jgi:hypothetical protein
MLSPKVKPLLPLCAILLGTLRVGAADMFRAVSIESETWEVTFKQEGIRFRLIVDGVDRGVSGYLQTLRMKRSERLTLIEKHSKFEIRPVDENGREGIEITRTGWDMRSGKDITTTGFEAEHLDDQTTRVPREGEALKLDAKEAKVLVETNEMKIPEDAVRSLLEEAVQNFHVVSPHDFTHQYSHVAAMDATGTIEWAAAKPPVTWRWTLRPGGLALLKKPDGEVILLARTMPDGWKGGGGKPAVAPEQEGAGKPEDGR